MNDPTTQVSHDSTSKLEKIWHKQGTRRQYPNVRLPQGCNIHVNEGYVIIDIGFLTT